MGFYKMKGSFSVAGNVLLFFWVDQMIEDFQNLDWLRQIVAFLRAE